ncbi:MAG TPA: MFS transporter [Caulobacteraceae bacterium]|jgi:GPH family glycoside/pentoside/hexuronide:cation symporter
MAVNAPDFDQGPPTAGGQRHEGRVGFPILAAYGAGAGVDTIVNFAVNGFLLFYLTLGCGLPGSLAGLVGLISLSLDALVDPLVGSISDNLHGKLGRRHPFLLLSPVPTGLFLVLLFAIPSGLSGWGLFAFATIVSLVLRVAMSCFQVPFFALGAELSEDYSERSTIVGARVTVGIALTLLIGWLSYGVFLAPKGALTHKAAYFPLMVSFAALIIVGGLLSAFGTLGARDRLHAPPPQKGPRLAALIVEIREVFANPSFRVLFFAILLFFIAQGVAGPLTLYANIYFWKISTHQILILTFLAVAGLALGLVLTFLARSLEKRTVTLAGVFLFLSAQLIPAPLRAAGLLKTEAQVMAVLSVAVIALGIATTAAIIGYNSMMADAVDEHEHLFGARREGLYFAGINFSVKASSGLGTFIAGIVLDLIGFPHAASAGSAVYPSAATVLKLGLIYGPGVAVVSAVSVTLLFLYRIDRARHDQILKALGRSPNQSAA